MSAVPPSDSRRHTLSTSSVVPHATRNDTDGLNVNTGPALIAMNGWPESENDTMSQSPDGVSRIVVTFVTFDSGRAAQYNSAASLSCYLSEASTVSSAA
jgi:hypothetical protein